jgi:hypothetical protein
MSNLIKVIKTNEVQSKKEYKRPESTITDSKQTNEKMEEMLHDYVRIGEKYGNYHSIDDVPLQSHVRYVTLKDRKPRFCLGGFIKKIYPEYVVLTNNKVSWSVQKYHWKSSDTDSEDDRDSETGEKQPLFVTIFFKKKTREDELSEVIEIKNKKIVDLETKETEQKTTITTLEKEVEKQKEQCFRLIQIIKSKE